jgi:hypothetical protein
VNGFIAVRSDSDGNNTETLWTHDKEAAYAFCPAPPEQEQDGQTSSGGVSDEVSFEIVATY